MQIKAHNFMAHHILKNEVDLILPKFCEGQKRKREIFGTLLSGFIGIAFEDISSFIYYWVVELCKIFMAPQVILT